MDIQELPQDEATADIPHLRFLRLLVSVLAGTMIVGLLVLIVLIVIRFREERTNPTPVFPELPSNIALPAGAAPVAITAGAGWYLVMLDDGQALMFATDGAAIGSAQFDLPE